MKIIRCVALLAWFVLSAAELSAAEPLVTQAEQSSAAEPDEHPEAQSAKTAEQTKEERIQAILTETMPESEYRDLTRCLSTRSYRTVEILSDQYLIFKGSRDRVWVNRLRHRCLGLRRNDTLEFRLFGQSICDMDRVSAIDLSFGGVTTTCSLGPFEKIDEYRAEALKVAIRQARKS